MLLLNCCIKYVPRRCAKNDTINTSVKYGIVLKSVGDIKLESIILGVSEKNSTNADIL